jgi:hypothetical protein
MVNVQLADISFLLSVLTRMEGNVGLIQKGKAHLVLRIHLDQEVMITFIFKTGMILNDYESILILVPYLEFLFKDFHFGC